MSRAGCSDVYWLSPGSRSVSPLLGAEVPLGLRSLGPPLVLSVMVVIIQKKKKNLNKRQGKKIEEEASFKN